MPELANRAPQALQAFPALVAFGESKPHCATCGVRNVCLPEGLEPEAVCELERVVYQIVGDDEADIKHGKISVSSPIARALIGKVEGDTADVQAPGGTRSYEILNVRYA